MWRAMIARVTGNIGLGLAIVGLVGSFVVQSVFQRQVDRLDPSVRDEVSTRLGRLWIATAVVALAVGFFIVVGKGRTALYITVGILLANASAVAVFKHRVLGQIADLDARSRLRRISLGQLAASVTMFSGVAVYVLSAR
jgi:hypothetical protein